MNNIDLILQKYGKIKFERLVHGDRVIGYICFFPSGDGKEIGAEAGTFDGLLTLLDKFINTN